MLAGLVASGVQAGELPDQDVNMAALGMAGIVIQLSVGAEFGRVSLPISAHLDSVFTMCWRMAGGTDPS
ncbi:hypothetical protein LOC54_07970 [Acetobacter sp. AN02]|uniref:hypothetical protein n=1 Tax=Acetobacter sp. AN02 TaxID=2894186 RepID=UPI0024344854|nr:hypothetical protein [Acetobacter sp. AN02]MDG6095045.1 hypothetical protein [Acetobacter sp. AN02]